MKDKIISFPEDILDVLEDYKQKTGIPATDYIRKAVVKEMIQEKLIFIRTKYISVDTKEMKEEKINAPSQDVLYCDSDKCEVDPRIGAGCG